MDFGALVKTARDPVLKVILSVKPHSLRFCIQQLRELHKSFASSFRRYIFKHDCYIYACSFNLPCPRDNSRVPSARHPKLYPVWEFYSKWKLYTDWSDYFSASAYQRYRHKTNSWWVNSATVCLPVTDKKLSIDADHPFKAPTVDAQRGPCRRSSFDHQQSPIASSSSNSRSQHHG